MRRRPTLARLARLVAIAVVIAITVNSVVWAIADWHLADMRVYQDAALRLRAGTSLYAGDADALSAYRYAPWFAYAWIPITLLPQEVINVGWSTFLLAGSAIAVWASIKHQPVGTRLIVAILMTGVLFGISAIGNVHGPMLALLMIGIPRAWGGLAVGVTASLKLFPLLLVLIFVAQRRWIQAAIAIVTTAVLWLPAAFMPADPVTFDPGPARTLAPLAWATLAIAALLLASWAAWRRSATTPLLASTAAVLAIPRLFVYEISMVMVGLIDIRRDDDAPGETASLTPPGGRSG